MNISKSFDETLKRYGITGAVLSKKMGISPSHISQFRNGKGGAVSHTTLEDMLNAINEIAPGSRRYFCQLLAEEPLSEKKINSGEKLIEMIENASDDEMVMVMMAMSRRWKSKSRTPGASISNDFTNELDSPIAV